MKFTKAHIHEPRWATVVRAERKRLRLTQVEFGNFFGVSHTSISNWESGRISPNPEFCWWYVQQLERKLERAKAK